MKTFSAALGLLALASLVLGDLQQVTGFGTNPTNLQMYISVPSKTVTNSPIIVAVSFLAIGGCTGQLLIMIPRYILAGALRNSGTAALTCRNMPTAKASF